MSYHLQQQIKNNASDIRQYVNDLYEWEQQKEVVQAAKKQQKKNQPKPPSQPQTEPQPQTNQQFKRLKRDINTVSDYYKAWDKFDVDVEVDKLQKEEKEKHKPFNPYQNTANNIRAKPKAQMVVKGGRNVTKDPTSLKDRGNLHFKANQYQKAIECYTECLAKAQQVPSSKNNNELMCIVFSNRAMAHLKKGNIKQAFDDCNSSLELDPAYVKSYLRRASALKRMKRYKQALKDYVKAQSLDATNQQAKDQQKRIQAHLKALAKEARQSLIRKERFSSINTERLSIEQIQEEEQAQKKPLNYLQEL